MFQDLTSLVVDIGNFTTKVGYGGDEAPRIVTSSCLAEPVSMEEDREFFVGTKYLNLDKTDLEIQTLHDSNSGAKYPRINEQLLAPFIDGLLVQELKTNIKDYSILVSEDINLPLTDQLEQRSKMAEILFEKFNIPNLFFLKTPVLACFASGRSTALVVDSGELSTRVSSVHEGFILNKTAKIIPYGGKNISHQLLHYFHNSGQHLCTRYQITGRTYTKSFLDYHQNMLINDIKQTLCSQSNQQVQEGGKITYQLPDRKTITIDQKAINCPLQNTNGQWNVQIGDYTYRNLAESVADTINTCDIEIRKELYSSILVTGGNSMFKNTIPTTVNKVSSIAPPNARVKAVSIINRTEKKYLSWIGGSIVTSLSAFQSYWVGNQEWKELGRTVLERKCL